MILHIIISQWVYLAAAIINKFHKLLSMILQIIISKLMQPKGKPTELINQVALLHQSGLVPSTTSVPILCCTAFIHHFQHLFKHIVDMPYINNSWSVKEFKDELKNQHTHVKSTIIAQAHVVYQRLLVIM